jgi:threonine dehydratase
VPVYLKAELFQRTGSFKPRGVLNKLASLSAEEKQRGVIGISAGNHAQALAYGAAQEGVDALVVMWRGASEQKLAATRAYGAEVDLEATGPGDAFDRLHRLIEETGRTLVHPFDDPLVIAGQGTVGLEIEEEAPAAGVVVVPVGGGGLVSGVAAALNARIIAVEPEGSRALHEGLARGRPVDVEPQSVADGLNAPFAGANAIEICRGRGVESVLVSEAEIEEGFRFLYGRAKLACEPAAAAGVAALLAGKVPLGGAGAVAVVVSGGNVASETAVAILARR